MACDPNVQVRVFPITFFMLIGIFGFKNMAAIEMPPVDTPIQTDRLAYHLRQGKHDITSYDWAQFMDFADKQFGK